MRAAEVIALLGIGLRAAVARPGSASVVILGCGGAVIILCFFLAVSSGLESAMIDAGQDDRAVILRRGSDTEVHSSLPLQVRDALLAQPEIAVDAAGQPLFTREIVRVLNLPGVEKGEVVAFPVRGVGDEHQSVRPEVRITQGRMFNPGTHELVVGRAIMKSSSSLQVGDEVSIKGAKWRITGVFSSGGTSRESEILADRDALLSLYRETNISSVTVKLNSAEQLAAFKKSLESDPRFRLHVMAEKEYFDALATRSSAPIRTAAVLVGSLMVLAAVFAAMNAIHSSVSSRSAELKTLSVLGFASNTIVVAQMLEAILLCLLGALLAAILAWTLLEGSSIRLVVGAGRLSQTAFDLRVTGEALTYCMLCGVLVGVASGLPPALRSVRMNNARVRLVQE